MYKLALAFVVTCGFALLGHTPVAAVDLSDLKRQQQQLVVTFSKEKQTLRRATTLTAVARSGAAASRQVEGFAAAADSLMAEFLKLQVNDPNNDPKKRREVLKSLEQLRKLKLAMAEAQRRAAQQAREEAEKHAEANVAEKIAGTLEDLIEEAEPVVEKIMGLLGR